MAGNEQNTGKGCATFQFFLMLYCVIHFEQYYHLGQLDQYSLPWQTAIVLTIPTIFN